LAVIGFIIHIMQNIQKIRPHLTTILDIVKQTAQDLKLTICMLIVTAEA